MRFSAGSLCRAALIAATLLESFVLAGGAIEGRLGRRSSAAVRSGQPMVALVGYGLNRESTPSAPHSGCTALRVVSKQCGFCREEEPEWRRLEPALSRKGCTLALLLPTLADAPYYGIADQIPEVVWVPLDWAAGNEVTVTPTTILRVGGRVIFSKGGELAPADDAAIRSLLARLPDR